MGQLTIKGTEQNVGAWRPCENLKDEAYTPRWLLDFVTKIEPIDTDCCWSPLSFVKPQAYGWTVQQDGLNREWFGHVWCNPTYSNVTPWVESITSRYSTVSLLLNIDPTTQWHDSLAKYGHDLRSSYFIDLKRRVDFYRPFAKTKGEGNRYCSRLYLINHNFSSIAEALRTSRVGDLQRLGGIAC